MQSGHAGRLPAAAAADEAPAAEAAEEAADEAAAAPLAAHTHLPPVSGHQSSPARHDERGHVTTWQPAGHPLKRALCARGVNFLAFRSPAAAEAAEPAAEAAALEPPAKQVNRRVSTDACATGGPDVHHMCQGALKHRNLLRVLRHQKKAPAATTAATTAAPTGVGAGAATGTTGTTACDTGIAGGITAKLSADNVCPCPIALCLIESCMP